MGAQLNVGPEAWQPNDGSPPNAGIQQDRFLEVERRRTAEGGRSGDLSLLLNITVRSLISAVPRHLARCRRSLGGLEAEGMKRRPSDLPSGVEAAGYDRLCGSHPTLTAGASRKSVAGRAAPARDVSKRPKSLAVSGGLSAPRRGGQAL